MTTDYQELIVIDEDDVWEIQELAQSIARQSQDYPAELALRGLDYDNQLISF
jgi:hypothetical protein